MRCVAPATQPARGTSGPPTRVGLAVLALVGCGLAPDRAAFATDLAAAQRQFLTSCGACHVASAGNAAKRQGPNLHGIYGRPAGARPDFAYSAALKGGGWVWDDAALDGWIENAQEARPGTIMNYRQSDPDRRALIIAFLKSLAPAASGQAKAP